MVVRKAIRLVEINRSISIVVGRAKKSRYEVMREERASYFVGLLGVFVGRRGGQEHRPFAHNVVPDEKSRARHDRSALDPGQTARPTRIEDRQAKRSGRPLNQPAKLVEAQAGVPEVKGLLVGVAGVIDEQGRVFRSTSAYALSRGPDADPVRRGRGDSAL